MNYIYVVFLKTWWSDLDSHYDNDPLGFYSTEEKAKKRLDDYLEGHTKPDGRIDIGYDDEWRLSVEKIPLDKEYDTTGEILSVDVTAVTTTIYEISNIEEEEE